MEHDPAFSAPLAQIHPHQTLTTIITTIIWTLLTTLYGCKQPQIEDPQTTVLPTQIIKDVTTPAPPPPDSPRPPSSDGSPWLQTRSISLGDTQTTAEIFWALSTKTDVWAILGSRGRAHLVRIGAERLYIIEKSFVNGLLCGIWLDPDDRPKAGIWQYDGSSQVIDLEELMDSSLPPLPPQKPPATDALWPWSPNGASSCAIHAHGNSLWWVSSTPEHPIGLSLHTIHNNTLTPLASAQITFTSNQLVSNINVVALDPTSNPPQNPFAALVAVHTQTETPRLWHAQTSSPPTKSLTLQPLILPPQTTTITNFSENGGGVFAEVSTPDPALANLVLCPLTTLQSPTPPPNSPPQKILGQIPPHSLSPTSPPLSSPPALLLTPRLFSPVGSRLAAVIPTSDPSLPLTHEQNIHHATLITSPSPNPLLLTLQRQHPHWLLKLSPIPPKENP